MVRVETELKDKITIYEVAEHCGRGKASLG